MKIRVRERNEEDSAERYKKNDNIRITREGK